MKAYLVTKLTLRTVMELSSLGAFMFACGAALACAWAALLDEKFTWVGLPIGLPSIACFGVSTWAWWARRQLLRLIRDTEHDLSGEAQEWRGGTQ